MKPLCYRQFIRAGPVFFALNMGLPNKLDDLYKREAIAREILKSIEAMPAN